MPQRLLRWCALFLSACLALVACGAQAPAAGPGEIRIGLIATLSGDLAESFGDETVDSVRLAIQPLNDAGGLEVAGRKYQVTLVIEDDQDKAELAASAAQKLINQDQVVALIGSSISRNAIPAADVAERSRVPMISPNSTNPATTAGKQYAFRVAFLDPFQGRVMARFALEDLGAQRAAVLYDVASAYNRDIAEVFRQVFSEGGGEVVAFETYTTGESDYRPQLARIRASGATVLFLPNYDNELPAQVEQAREVGIDATLLGSDAWSTLSPDVRAALEGSFFTTGWSRNLANAQSQAFVKAFRETYGREPNDISATAYDSVGLLLHAIQTQGKFDAESIRAGLAATSGYAGVTGTISYQGSGDPIKSAVINRIEGGEVVLHKQIDP